MFRQGSPVRLVAAVGINEDFAGSPCLEPLHAFGEVRHRDAVGDDGALLRAATSDHGTG